MEQFEIKLNKNQINDFIAISKKDLVLDTGTVRSGGSYFLCTHCHLSAEKYKGINNFIGRKTLKSLKETTFLKYIEILTNFFHYVEGRDFTVNRSSNPKITYSWGSTVIFGDLDANTINKWLSSEFSNVYIDEIQEVAEYCFDTICTRQTELKIQDENLNNVDYEKFGDYYLIKDKRTKQIKINGEYLNKVSDKMYKDFGLSNEDWVDTNDGFIFKYDDEIEDIKISIINNKLVGICNPPEEGNLHWLHNKFRNPATKIKNATVVYSDLRNNKKNIPAGYIERMYDILDKRTAERLLEGKWVPQNSKVVYADYDFPQDNNGNYIEGGNLKRFEYNSDFENTISMDFGWSHDMSIGYWQYDRLNDTHYRLYEVVGNHIKPEEYCKLLSGQPIVKNGKTYKPPFNARNAMIVVGAEANQHRQEGSGVSNLELIRSGLSVYNIIPDIRVSNPRILNSVSRVRSYILTASGKRKLFIHLDNCKRFIQDATIYHFKTDKEGNIVGELPDKDDVTDHTQDETRYYIHKKTPLTENKIYSQRR